MAEAAATEPVEEVSVIDLAQYPLHQALAAVEPSEAGIRAYMAAHMGLDDEFFADLAELDELTSRHGEIIESDPELADGFKNLVAELRTLAGGLT